MTAHGDNARPEPREPRPDFSMNRQFLRLPKVSRPLRIGIVCSDGKIPRYARQIVADIEACNFARLACIVAWPAATKPPPSPRRSLLYWLYDRLLEPAAQTDHDPLQRVEFTAETACPVLTADGRSRQTVERQLREQRLDVLLNFASAEASQWLAQTARHGVWFYRLDAQEIDGNGEPLVRKVLEDPANTAHIMLLAQRGGEAAVLREARFALTLSLSASENRYAPYFGSTWFVIEQLAALASQGKLRPRRMTKHSLPAPPGPGNGQIVRYLGRRLRGIVPRLPSLLRHRKPAVDWKIALRRAAYPLPEENANIALGQFRWLQSPPGRFWADPFLLRHDGRLWLFFEEYDRDRGKGHIACTEVDANGNPGTPVTVLEKPWHLSYPQVFELDGTIYMIPESVEHQTVDLYRARHFPDDWVHEKQLLDVAVVDATLHRHNGRWWMFASPMAVPGHAPVTCLWTADELTGEWKIASNLCVSDDVRHARNAGAVFRHQGRLYRVSQDCSARYGSALWFNRIEQWDDDHYREHPAKRIGGEPVAGLSGIHSYNRIGDLEVIDGRFETFVS